MPYISIVVITYNHENFIRQALDSIFMQNIDLTFEIIVGDDCSTDNTTEIIREYQQKYPNIVKPIIRSKNVGISRNWYSCFLKCSGKYISILDGDDYWTNENKLKTQIDFLEKNKTYIACSQRYSVVDENNKTIYEVYSGPGSPKSGDYTINDFEKYIYFGHPGTLIFRNIFLEAKYDYSIIERADRMVADITLCFILVSLGNIFISDDNMTAYRKVLTTNGSSYTSSIAKKSQIFQRIQFFKKLESYSITEFNIVLKRHDRSHYFLWWSLLYIMRYPTHHNWISLKKVYSLTENKISFPIYMFKKLPEFLLRLFKQFKKKLSLLKSKYIH